MKLLTQHIHQIMKVKTKNHIRKYSYKGIGSETVFVYQNPVKKETLTDQTAPKIKVFWTGRRE
jgi:hypothetical protein